MDFKKMSVIIGGETGTGKTTNAIKVCIDHAIENANYAASILFLDCDNVPSPRALDCISEHFPTYIDQIDVIEVCVEGVQKAGRVSKTDIYADYGGNSIDGLASYDNLVKKVIPELRKKITEYDYIIIDALYPQLRNVMGVSQWQRCHPDRVSPVEADYREISPIEKIVFDDLSKLCRLNGKPLIFTCKMTDNYENGLKSGRRFGIRDDVAYSASCIIEMLRSEPRKKGQTSSFRVVCQKSPRGGPWTDDIIPGNKELYDLLKENKVI
jgi:hypothetical protein